jgi:hypothetical protein
VLFFCRSSSGTDEGEFPFVLTDVVVLSFMIARASRHIVTLWPSQTYTNPKKLAGIDHMTYPFLRYFANRTGNLCYANLPILFLLVSRGNLISRISGIGLQVSCPSEWSCKRIGRRILG